MTCLYPHCCCVGTCDFGGAVPTHDPSVPMFERSYLRELADRHDLALAMDRADPGFHLSNDDMRAIAFALRFTAMKL